VIEIETAHGTIQVLYQITLGDFAIVTVVSLLLILHLIQWLLGSIWNGGRR
jgi:hypothetical protein